MAKHTLDLDSARPVLLVMAGGEGGGGVKKVLAEIAPAVRRLGLQTVVIAGRNETLRRRLTEIAPDLGPGSRVLGFIDNVADYMRAADVLLTKAGPGAIAEAAACGLPVVLYEYISGQEKGNLDYVRSRRAGIVALDAHSIIDALERLFAPGSTELAGMALQALKSARPSAAHDIASFLIDLLERRGLVSRIARRANP